MSNKIKPFKNGSIQKFEVFSHKQTPMMITNRVMRGIAESLKARGVEINGFEEPVWDNDGMFEIGENLHITVKRDGTMTGGVKIGKDMFVFTKESTDVSFIMENLAVLQVKHKINENSNYTTDFRSTNPQPATPYSKKQRAKHVADALRLIEDGLKKLKETPKIDWMSDIPSVINSLEEMLGSEEDSTGLRNLSKIYNEQAK